MTSSNESGSTFNGSATRISDEKKVDLLSAQLQERYSALHKMRDRSMQFVLWVLGFGLGLAWLSINEAVFTSAQKGAITVLLIILAVVTLMFVRAIACGFTVNRDIAVRIESALGLYNANCYGTDRAILPKQFSCQQTKWTGHFCTLYILVSVVVLLLLLLAWTNPSASVPHGRDASSNQDNVPISVVQE